MKSWLDGIIDRGLNWVENPEILLNQAYVDLQDEIIRVRKILAAIISEGNQAQVEVCREELSVLERALTVLAQRKNGLFLSGSPPQAKAWAIKSAHLGWAWASWAKAYRSLCMQKHRPARRGRRIAKLQEELESMKKKICLLDGEILTLQKALLLEFPEMIIPL